MTQQGSMSPAITRKAQARESMCTGRIDSVFGGILPLTGRRVDSDAGRGRRFGRIIRR